MNIDLSAGATLVSMLAQLKPEGFELRRDIVLAMTADEETGDEAPSNGVLWLLKHRRELIDAEFGLNEGADGQARQGKPFAFLVSAVRGEVLRQLRVAGARARRA